MHHQSHRSRRLVARRTSAMPGCAKEQVQAGHLYGSDRHTVLSVTRAAPALPGRCRTTRTAVAPSAGTRSCCPSPATTACCRGGYCLITHLRSPDYDSHVDLTPHDESEHLSQDMQSSFDMLLLELLLESLRDCISLLLISHLDRHTIRRIPTSPFMMNATIWRSI